MSLCSSICPVVLDRAPSGPLADSPEGERCIPAENPCEVRMLEEDKSR